MYHIHPAVRHLQAIVRNLKTNTGRDLEAWIGLLEMEGPVDAKARRDWLKTNFKLGGLTAATIVECADGSGMENADGDAYLAAAPAYIEKMFRGKENLRPAFDQILDWARAQLPELKICPCTTIVPLYREHVFAQLKPATRTRLELGLALKGHSGAWSDRLVDTGGLQKGDRITHRFHLGPGELPDAHMFEWLERAYELD